MTDPIPDNLRLLILALAERVCMCSELLGRAAERHDNVQKAVHRERERCAVVAGKWSIMARDAILSVPSGAQSCIPLPTAPHPQ